MKRRLLIALFTMCCLGLFAQTHIAVSDPDTWTAQELAPYIGQTVIFDVPVVVCANGSSALTVSPWRMFEPLNQGIPSSAEYKTAVHVNGTCFMQLGGVDAYHRCGEKIYHLKAKVNSTSSLTFLSGDWHGNTRADMLAGIPDLGDYRLLVCGFNLENYFVANYGSMGASSYTEHQRQRAKIHKALVQINADIYGLVELEKGNEAISEIVNDLNNARPERNYKYFHDSSTEAVQKADFVYDANVVEPVGAPGMIDAEVKHRKKIICFREIATGERFIFSINHFKAMSGGGDTESQRVNEARAVVSFYNSYRVNKTIRENDLLLMGDLNAYPFSKPILTLLENDLTDLHRAFHADSSYSYRQRNGTKTAYIDHALCNKTMLSQITGMSPYHLNSDETDDYNYKNSHDNSMFRCSDHDPVLVGLKLDSTISGAPYFNGGDMGADSLTFYYHYAPNEADTIPEVFFDIYTVSGFRICQPTRMTYYGIVPEARKKYYTLSDTNPYLPEEIKQFLPLPSGVYIIHIYYNGTVKAYKLIIR